MARPKTGKKKKNMMLTVDEQTRLELAYISQHHEKSISAIVTEWAHKETRRISKSSGTLAPDASQISVFD